jgi:hypothetical protein
MAQINEGSRVVAALCVDRLFGHESVRVAVVFGFPVLALAVGDLVAGISERVNRAGWVMLFWVCVCIATVLGGWFS